MLNGQRLNGGAGFCTDRSFHYQGSFETVVITPNPVIHSCAGQYHRFVTVESPATAA
ncbi:hypothetical protein GCM10023063_37510 [Arthrobacter methylotrophus]|uniref:Uncharacterized protein n=2 Tax=Arthrobacter methylotrophus TaxID=121291 RepID=A0ABV5UPW9_9MICC